MAYKYGQLVVQAWIEHVVAQPMRRGAGFVLRGTRSEAYFPCNSGSYSKLT